MCIFMCICVLSVALGERTFSKLKIIKNYLRSKTRVEGLNNLLILSIENQLARSIDFNSIIDDFAGKKARKVVL